MRPLQSIAMGLVVIGLHAEFAGYDALADPVGWLLVLLGVHGLPPDLDRKRALLVVAAVAGAVSVPLWFHGVSAAIEDVDESLLWVANLPQLAFAALLSHVLAGRAAASDDTRAAAWLRALVTGFVVVAVLPVLVFGGGVDSLEVPAYVAATLLLLALIWLLFTWSARPWAGAGEATTAAGPRGATTRAAPPEEERPS